MKVCSLCQREFEDQFQFCTRDGTKLTRIQERGYCRRCGKDYPHTLQKCPLHGTPLTEHGPRTILGDNFCHLCDSDFPKAFKLCPVHGIALQTSPLKKKLRNKIDSTDPAGKSADTPPAATNPLPDSSQDDSDPKEVSSHVLSTADLPRTDALVMSELPNVAPERASSIFIKPGIEAKEVNTRDFATGNLAIPDDVVLPMPLHVDTVGSRPLEIEPKTTISAPLVNSDSGEPFLSRFNSRHIVSAIMLALLLIVSVSAYNIFVKHPSLESIRFSDSGAQNGSQAQANNQAKTDAAKVADSATDQGKTTVKPANDTAVAAANVAAVTKPSRNPEPAATSTPVEQRHSQVKSVNVPEPPDSDDKAQSDKTRPIFIPKAKDANSSSQQSSQQTQVTKPDDDPRNNKKSSVRDVFEQVTPARPGSARVVPSIRNRRRIAVPGGFHYYFEVVLTELNGVGVNWEPATIERTSESGLSGTRTVGYDFAIGAHGHFAVKIEVDMIGSTSRDWKGTVIYRNRGKDENGHQITISYRIPLDESFRD